MDDVEYQGATLVVGLKNPICAYKHAIEEEMEANDVADREQYIRWRVASDQQLNPGSEINVVKVITLYKKPKDK